MGMGYHIAESRRVPSGGQVADSEENRPKNPYPSKFRGKDTNTEPNYSPVPAKFPAKFLQNFCEICCRMTIN